ncbi:hypothetical protein GCM10023322_41430 [Rugosimonospora acidiphila]|uniref:Collagen-like protein n=1 Tax=Rugosimonospora acidiphila TaxID=556531 RepID=A0ABP9RYS4_9ACTN
MAAPTATTDWPLGAPVGATAAAGPEGPTGPDGATPSAGTDGLAGLLGLAGGRLADGAVDLGGWSVGEPAPVVGAVWVGAAPEGLPDAPATWTETVPAPPVLSRHEGTRDTAADAWKDTETW